MAMTLICSTGVVSKEPVLTSPSKLLERLPLVDASAFEPIFYADWYDDSVATGQRLVQLGFAFPVLHAEKSIGPLLGTGNDQDQEVALCRLDDNCQMANTIGADLLVLHLWGLPDSDRQIERALAMLPRCVDICAGRGIELSIETIPCLVGNPLEQVQTAVFAESRISVTLDTEFLATHNQLDAALTRSLWDAGKVRHVHLKDFDGEPLDASERRRYLHPGEGSIDFDRVFSCFESQGFDGTVSLEASAFAASGAIDIARANQSLALIVTWLGNR